MASKWGLKEKLAELQKMKSTLPVILGAKIRNFSMDAFRKQGWTDSGFERWKPRKYKKKDEGRAILVKRGKLKRSIKVRSANWTRVIVGSYGIPYASVHNYGSRKMPKRTFLDKSQRLERELKGMIEGQFLRHLKK